MTRLRSLASTTFNRISKRTVISTHNRKPKPHLAASSYLNSAPLIWSFTRGSQSNKVTYVDAVPARCAELLATAEAQFALVPVIEYQRVPDFKLIPHVCVGSREKVRSVLLVSRLNNLKKIRSVALDESSRTSAALVKVIFKEFLETEPIWMTSIPDVNRMLRESDAALVIGDPAMTFERKGLNVWDLAMLWREFTGRGFVFAMWMAKGSFESTSIDFVAARDEGVNALEKILDDYEERLRLPREELSNYLTNNVTFDLDEDLEAGMQLYFELSARHGLIDKSRPLEFCETNAG